MRTILVVLAAFMLASSFALRVQQQQKIMEKVNNIKLQSSFGKAMKSLISLSKFEELAEVEQIMNEVEDEIRTNRKTLVDELAATRDAHRNVVQGAEATLASQYDDLHEHESQRDTLRQNIVDKKQQIDDALALIAKTQNDIVVENDRREKEHEKNMKIKADQAEAERACNEALPILQELKSKDLSQSQQVAPLSLAQMSSDKVRSHLFKIKQHLGKLSLISTHTTYVPMLQIFLELADAGINADLMDEIIQKVQELAQKMRDEQEATQKADDEDEARHVALINRYNDLIAKLTDAVAAYRKELAALEAELERVLAYIENLEKTIAAAERALLGKKIRYDEVAEHLEESIDRLRVDLDVLALAIKCLVNEGADAACEAAPEAETQCFVTAYAQEGFAGDASTLNGGAVANAFASFRVHGDCTANFYANDDFTGARKAFTAGDNASGNAKFGSVRLVPNTPCSLILYSNYGNGAYSEAFNGDAASLTSNFHVAGYTLTGDKSCRATLFTQANFAGEQFGTTEGQSGIIPSDFAGKIASAKIWRARVQA